MVPSDQAILKLFEALLVEATPLQKSMADLLLGDAVYTEALLVVF